MKESQKDLLRRMAISRKLKQLVKRPTFAPQDLRDAIESKLAEGLIDGELSEDAAREIALDMHPDLKALELAGTLPAKMLDEHDEVWDPRLHIALHTVIERQLATGEPTGIVPLAIQFEREGKLCAHEIKHVIAYALSQQIWSMLHENTLFNEKQYFADIEATYLRYCETSEQGDEEEQ